MYCAIYPCSLSILCTVDCICYFPTPTLLLGNQTDPLVLLHIAKVRSFLCVLEVQLCPTLCGL